MTVPFAIIWPIAEFSYSWDATEVSGPTQRIVPPLAVWQIDQREDAVTVGGGMIPQNTTRGKIIDLERSRAKR